MPLKFQAWSWCRLSGCQCFRDDLNVFLPFWSYTLPWRWHNQLVHYSTQTNSDCRYDPDTSIQDDIDNIPERVKLLQETAQTMLTKARLKLNIKRLYAADGRAVRELLKVASLLYKASSKASQDAEVRFAVSKTRRCISYVTPKTCFVSTYKRL